MNANSPERDYHISMNALDSAEFDASEGKSVDPILLGKLERQEVVLPLAEFDATAFRTAFE